jgi:hypothetical protein
VLDEVSPDAGEKLVPAQMGDELPEHRGALAVADRVVVSLTHTCSGSSDRPFRMISCTLSARSSAWLPAPGRAQLNLITEADPKSSSPLVKSSATS